MSESQWNGNIFLSRKRIIFVGEAGNTTNQNIHAVKICIALNGDFEFSDNSGAKGNRYSAVIINAGISHAIKCDGNQVFLIYLLPETVEADSLSREYLCGGRSSVYDIPRELIENALPLTEMRQACSEQDCGKVFEICDRVIRGLGKIRGREFSISSALNSKLSPNVQAIIEYIYSKIETQVLNGNFNQKDFKSPAIAAALGWKETGRQHKFKSETGISVERFFRDIQMLASLKFYAVCESMRKAEIENLRERLNREDLNEAEQQRIWRRLKEIEKKTPLTKISDALGYGGLDRFSERIHSRLGISLTDIRGNSDFFSCEEQSPLSLEAN